jgi:hypothetical protein
LSTKTNMAVVLRAGARENQVRKCQPQVQILIRDDLDLNISESE